MSRNDYYLYDDLAITREQYHRIVENQGHPISWKPMRGTSRGHGPDGEQHGEQAGTRVKMRASWKMGDPVTHTSFTRREEDK